MEQLSRIVHNDGSSTIYWRCPASSHVEVKQTQVKSQPKRDRPSFKSGDYGSKAANVHFGSLPDILRSGSYVRFTPKADIRDRD